MKRLAFFSSLFVTIMIVLASCSNEENDTPPPGKILVSFPIKYDIVAAANSTSKTSTTVNLTDILAQSGHKDKAKYVTGGVVETQSTISFSGITDSGVKLSNIMFSTDDNVIKNIVLNDSFTQKALVLSRDTVLKMGEPNYLNLLGQISKYLATKKNIKLNASYTVDNTIKSGIIELNISATFGW